MVMVNVETLDRENRREAARVASRAFLRNPMQLAVFQSEDERTRRRQEAVFAALFDHFPGELFAARWGKPVVGVMGVSSWPDCRYGTRKGLAMLPRLLFALRGSMPRALTWLSAWSEFEPKEPHLHLGPVAVLPKMQRQGVGSRMLQRFIERVDQRRVAGYLETDTPDAVRLYERFGFKVRHEAEVLGVHNWFMWREPEPEFMRRARQRLEQAPDLPCLTP